MYADSHSRGLAERVSDNLQHKVVVQGYIKPGAKTDDVLSDVHCETVDKVENYVILFSGTNDVACNEGSEVIKKIRSKISNINYSKIIVVNVPHRYDLIKESCVNVAIQNTNTKLKYLCDRFRTVALLDVSAFERGKYTKHVGKNLIS